MSWEFAFLDALQNIRTPLLDVFFEFVTHLGDGGYLWIALAIIFCISKKTRVWGICMLASLAVGALITNVTLKPLVARQRPCWINETVELLIAMPHGYSFPSGHSQGSFVAATALFWNNKKWGIPALILAALIAFSRLYLYVHFPTDVLAGSLIGIGVGTIITWAIRNRVLPHFNRM